LGHAVRTILIRGGLIITERNTFTGDVLTQGERIAEVAARIDAHADQVVDASGLYVLPGLMDTHVHFRDPGGTQKEDFASGTRAALAGGFTAIVDMPNTEPPTATLEALRAKNAIIAPKAQCDYAFWFGATPDNVDVAVQASEDPTVAGLKLYMGSSTGTLLVDQLDATLRHFSAFPKQRPLAVHAEDEAIMRIFAETAGEAHNEHRPPLAAALAVSRAIHLAAFTDRRLHIAHLSTEAELAEVTLAKSRGVHVTCEVAPHHLYLTENDQERWGGRGKVNPPLRSVSDVRALWKGLDMIDLIATDHAPHTQNEKAMGYSAAPSGFPGLETALPLMQKGVVDGKLTLERLVQLMAVGPAALVGAQRKGRLAPGYDADVLLFDPAATWIMDPQSRESRARWSPWEGTKMTGRVERVFLRGQEVVVGGVVRSSPGIGKPLTFMR
jgi:dihydroorotase